MHSVHCKRIPQHAKIKLVAESATLLLFFAVLDSINKYLKFCTAQSCSKNMQMLFADSTYICGFHLHFADSTYILRNSLTVAEFRTTCYIC